MSFVNFSTKEITSKIVYYGPGLCGKTTTLQYVYDSIVPENKGQIVSLATDVDRTIYFDFLPLKLGKIQSFSVRIQLYTVPGQVRYNSTRKLVLSGTDGVVFVADSQKDLMEENVKSYKNLLENLREHGLSLESLPHIFQYNKRDLTGLASVSELNKALNQYDSSHFETCATTGEGVLEGLKTISKLVMQDLNRKGVVDRKQMLSYQQERARTDAILRPLVGLADLGGRSPGVAAATLVDEYRDPLHRIADPVRSSATPDPLAPPAATRREGRRVPLGHTLSLSEVFPPGELADAVLALEDRIQAGDPSAVQKRVKDLFGTLIGDASFFPPDMTESARISMLGISLRKYAHFYRLLSQPRLERDESLFLLHFLVDVQFGKGMP